MSTLLASIFRPRLATGILATFLSAACLPTASAESFTAVDLYTLTGPAGITTVQASGSPQSAAPGGGVVGYGSGTGTGNNYHALLWNGSSVATDLHPSNLDFKIPVFTANGQVTAARIKLDRVEIDNIRVDDVDAVVLPQGAMKGTLLGMSFLSKLSSFKSEDGVLTLKN